MHLKVQQRGGRTYLSVVQSYREGQRVRTRTIQSIGYAEDYAHLYPDPVAHFREEVAYRNRERLAGQLSVHFSPGEEVAEGGQAHARLGAAIALGCLDTLEACAALPTRGNATHARRVLELFATERMLHVANKRETWEGRAAFPRACNFTLEQAYEALPIIAQASDAITTHLRETIRKYTTLAPATPNNTISVIVGSYRFLSLRAQGATAGAREVHCAVALSPEGMPIGYRLIDGPLTPMALSAATTQLKASTGAKRAVVVTGRTEQADAVASNLLANGDGFVLYQPLLQADANTRAWIDDAHGYTQPASGAYRMKSRVVHKRFPALGTAPVKQLVLWGRDYTPSNGYATLQTSETCSPGAAAVNLFRELWRQAEPFQVLEADFQPTPAPVAADDLIRAHFAICYCAFCAMRLLRAHMGNAFNAAQVADTLLAMEGVHVQDNLFLFSNRSAVSDAIQQTCGLPVAQRIMRAEDIHRTPARVRNALQCKALGHPQQ